MKFMNFARIACGIMLVTVATPACTDAESVDDTTSASTSQELARAAGWHKLAETQVDGFYDRDVLTLGMDDGRFSALQLRVEGGSLAMFGIRVVFGNGEVFEPNVRLVFDENTRSRVIDLPGNTRFIRRVEFRYADLPGGGRARVELFGKNTLPPPAWENLGELSVNGSHDRDSLFVGGDEGPFTAMQIRVKRSALVMENIRVTFGNGEVFEPRVRMVFDENTQSRVIDLPGTRRYIKRVDFKYSDLRGGGNAVVQFWATK